MKAHDAMDAQNAMEPRKAGGMERSQMDSCRCSTAQRKKTKGNAQKAWEGRGKGEGIEEGITLVGAMVKTRKEKGS